MATKKFSDKPKYSAGIQSDIETCYGDSITEVRKMLYAKVRNKYKWRSSDPVGYAYEYGMVKNYLGKMQWGIKRSLAYIRFDKDYNLLLWAPEDKSGHGYNVREQRIVKADGTLGMTLTAYIQMMNKVRGL